MKVDHWKHKEREMSVKMILALGFVAVAGIVLMLKMAGWTKMEPLDIYLWKEVAKDIAVLVVPILEFAGQITGPIRQKIAGATGLALEAMWSYWEVVKMTVERAIQRVREYIFPN